MKNRNRGAAAGAGPPSGPAAAPPAAGGENVLRAALPAGPVPRHLSGRGIR